MRITIHATPHDDTILVMASKLGTVVFCRDYAASTPIGQVAADVRAETSALVIRAVDFDSNGHGTDPEAFTYHPTTTPE